MPRTTRPGCCRTARRSTRLVAIAADAGAHLLVDEVYRYLEFEAADRLPAGAEALERGISLGVMSKSFAMAGLADRLARDARPRPARPLCRIQGLHDDLLGGAVGDPGAHRPAGARRRSLPGRRPSSAANLERLDAFFDEWADRFTWVRPRAGSVGFPRLTVPGVSIDDWAAGLVEAQGVLLLPGSQFGFGGNHFRLGFGRTDLPEALDRLETHARSTLR